MNIREENNQAQIVGEVVKEFAFNHEVLGEKFYISYVKVSRLSENYDSIPIMVSDRLVDVTAEWTGSWIKVEGQFRSRNIKVEDGRTRLDLFLFAMDVEAVTDPGTVPKADVNRIRLEGYFCKKPVYRKTPLGREIADVLLAVNRQYGKSDYLPCICWGRNARYTSGLDIGAHVVIVGRIQSRTYMKAREDGSKQECTAWEISAQSVQMLEYQDGGTE